MDKLSQTVMSFPALTCRPTSLSLARKLVKPAKIHTYRLRILPGRSTGIPVPVRGRMRVAIACYEGEEERVNDLLDGEPFLHPALGQPVQLISERVRSNSKVDDIAGLCGRWSMSTSTRTQPLLAVHRHLQSRPQRQSASAFRSGLASNQPLYNSNNSNSVVVVKMSSSSSAASRRALHSSAQRKQDQQKAGVTYKHQASLPHLPIPTLENTAAKFLESARPFVSDVTPGAPVASEANPTADYKRLKEAVEDFKTSPLVKELQQRLEKHAEGKDSWLIDWFNSANYFGESRFFRTGAPWVRTGIFRS